MSTRIRTSTSCKQIKLRKNFGLVPSWTLIQKITIATFTFDDIFKHFKKTLLDEKMQTFYDCKLAK